MGHGPSTQDPPSLDAVWAAVDDHYRRTADLLDGLSDEQWQQPSLCDGWTVRHVAAHLTLQQMRVRDVAAFVARHPSVLRHPTLNGTIRCTAALQARLPTPELVRRVRAMVGAHRHNAFVTPLETLTDVLVHSQDIAVPLGLELPVRPDAAALAATRQWDVRGTWLTAVLRPLPLEGLRLTATDTDWARGQGPPVEGPVGALLLLLTGRPAALEQLAGPGADALRARARTALRPPGRSPRAARSS